MGQSQSHSKEPLRPPAPVKTLDQFLARFRLLATTMGLGSLWIDSETEMKAFNDTFHKFASTSASPNSAPIWDQSSMLAFLCTAVPEPLWPDLENAVPLLHRCILRLGSFPYHNVQPEKQQQLTPDVLTTALCILNQQSLEMLLYLEDVFVAEDNVASDLFWDNWLHRVMFQSLTTSTTTTAGAVVVEPPAADKSDADDEHLLMVHRLLEGKNKNRDIERDPKTIVIGEPIIPVADLPSSRSQDFGGAIPESEFKSLVKLLVFFQLVMVDLEPGPIFKRLPEETNKVFTTFLVPNHGTDIRWSAFEKAANAMEHNLFHSLGNMFTLLFYPKCDVFLKE